MSELTIDQALQTALQWQQAGRIAEAEQVCRQILTVQPQHAGAANLLGSLSEQMGHLEEAASWYRRAIEFKPDYARAYYNLAALLVRLGRVGEAVPAFRKVVGLRPDVAEAHSNLGNALMSVGDFDEALACYQRAITMQPDYVWGHFNYGTALIAIGRLEEAIGAFKQALMLKPNEPRLHLSLGNVLNIAGRANEALASYQEVLRLNPGYVDAYNNMAIVLSGGGRLEEALACCREALRLKPDFAEAHGTLGNVLAISGQLDEAMACFKRVLEFRPDHTAAHSSLIFAKYLHPAYDALAIREEFRRWNQQHEAPLAAQIKPHGNNRSPNRRLRVGYVSPDFSKHAVGRAIWPLLSHHDHGQFEIFCYSDVRAPDELTAELRGTADQWRNIAGMPDQRVAEVIRKDAIDILVDLSMHTNGNRLLVFARKPAPVQVTFLAYAGSTGLTTMDYRFTDRYIDPEGSDTTVHSEKSVRLETYWCYQQSVRTPEVNALPALANGHVTFGSLNSFFKVSDPALEGWGNILRSVPGSRLILHSGMGGHRQRVSGMLGKMGITPDRWEFQERSAVEIYFATYQKMDIALDPFPYTGGTTTCDALWMGVPVVTVTGGTSVSRGGASILSNVGGDLVKLIAENREEYVRIAAALAGDLPRLATLRQLLRGRMQNSPLMDAERYARTIETKYREMWQMWCAVAP